MQHTFEMMDSGEIVYFMVMEIKKKQNEVFINQKKVCKRHFDKVQNGKLQREIYSNVSKGEIE